MKVKADEACFGPALQALGALDWILVRIVFNVRARTAKALRRDLGQEGIEVPESIMESAKWFQAFHAALLVPNHQRGFMGLLGDRLIDLGFDGDVVRRGIEALERDVSELCLDVQSAVARELCADLEATGIQMSPSVLHSADWRDIFAWEQRKLPPAAANIVRTGSDGSRLFTIVAGRRAKST